jgi:hypothetical protein
VAELAEDVLGLKERINTLDTAGEFSGANAQ